MYLALAQEANHARIYRNLVYIIEYHTIQFVLTKKL